MLAALQDESFAACVNKLNAACEAYEKEEEAKENA